MVELKEVLTVQPDKTHVTYYMIVMEELDQTLNEFMADDKATMEEKDRL